MQRLSDRARPRRTLSLTSLIDVIFLLLLFFMLSSTFTRFSELQIATVSGGRIGTDTPPLFLRVSSESISLNGSDTNLNDLTTVLAEFSDTKTLLISMADGVTSQRLTDVLVVLKPVDELAVTVLEN